MMNIYMAALYSNGYKLKENVKYGRLNESERKLVDGLPFLLESFHYVGKQNLVDAMRKDGAKVFLDSGAFSACTLGITLSVKDYCEYIKQNHDIIRKEDGVTLASVLDGIGDPLQTYRNQLEMEARGVTPLPCFHFGEDERYLEYYIKNYEYITIGGLVPVTTKQADIWLDRIWNKYLVDGAGKPKLKVHAFGVTTLSLMENFPWYSCDSSSWTQSAAFGGILTPKWGPVQVSEKSPSRHDKGQHASTLSPLEQNVLFKHLEEVGFTYERLSKVYESRAAYNLWSFGVIEAMINASKSEKFKARVRELF